MKILIAGIALCFGFAYVVDVLALLNAQKENEYASRKWVKCEAVVTAITSHATGARFGGSGLIIKYKYLYQNSEYIGSSQNFYKDEFPLVEQKKIADYNYGEVLTVWLNPEEPQQSVVSVEGEEDGRYPRRILRSSVLSILSILLAVVVYFFGSRMQTFSKKLINGQNRVSRS
jgi:hypothetical protein